MDIEKYVEGLVGRALHDGGLPCGTHCPEPMEAVLKGLAVELWSDAAGRLFLVADEDDAHAAIARLGAHRGEVYTAAEARQIISVGDPEIVREIHNSKRQFDGVVSEFQKDSAGAAQSSKKR